MNTPLRSLILKLRGGRGLSPEALSAYLHKLPSKIEVTWERDGKFIIGTISADGLQFMTQAKNADEFVEMVNDAIYAAYNIPDDYLVAMKHLKAYQPPQHDLQALRDTQVTSSMFASRRASDELMVRTA